MSKSISRWFAELARANPQRPALTCGDRTVTRSELERAANRLAHAYAARGVAAGDYVTLALPNSIEFFESALAIWKLGATPHPVSSLLPRRERDAIVALVDPSLIVGLSDGEAPPGRASVPPGFVPGSESGDETMISDRLQAAWTVMTSGGSTGRPKVIVSGTPGDAECLVAAALGANLTPDLTQLVLGPLYHNSPFGTSMWGLLAGQHLVVLPRFNATDALQAITEHRIGFISPVPTMMHRMLRELRAAPERYDLGSLRWVYHMASVCPDWLKEAWIELVGPDALIEVYGATEGLASTMITGREWLEHRGSVGRVVAGEIRVFNALGEPAAFGEVGEIFMRRPDGATPSYHYIGAEPHTAPGGWESVGDLGWMAADGYLYISDRRTDLVISGGANVYPAEVEAALLEHPQIVGAIVVGLPDDDLGAKVHAVVHATEPIETVDLVSFLGARLVRYKIPRSFRFVDEFLRDDAGKARRAEVRAREIKLLGESRGLAPTREG